MGAAYRALKIAAPQKPLNVVLEDSYIYNLYTRCEQTNEFYYDLIAMRLSRFENFESSYTSQFHTQLTAPTDESIKKVAERIEYYVDFDDYLAKVNIFSQYLLYSSVAKKLFEEDYGESKASLSLLIKEYPNIKARLVLEPEIILNKFDQWWENFPDKITIENFKTKMQLQFIEDSYKSDLNLCKESIKLVKEYLATLTLEDWYNSFGGKDNYNKRIVDLLEDFVLPQLALDEIKNVLKDIAETTLEIPQKKNWQATIDRLIKQNKSPKAIFNTVRDVFLRKDNMNSELFLFFSNWLFKYSDLIGKDDVMRIIFNDKISRNDECLEVIIANEKVMKEIINQRPDDSVDFKGALQEKISSSDNQSFVEFATSLGIEIEVKTETQNL